MFGAKGDGITNDSVALARLAAAVNQRGGGTIEFRKRTYLVGGQRPTGSDDAPFAFEPVRLLEFSKCTRPLVIRGNGARLKCAPRLRFGTFLPDGSPARPAMPYLGPGKASPYDFMIKVEDCTAAVDISDIYRPTEAGHFMPTPTNGMPVQSNDVYFEKRRGLIYVIDRLSGLDILEYRS